MIIMKITDSIPALHPFSQFKILFWQEPVIFVNFVIAFLLLNYLLWVFFSRLKNGVPPIIPVGL